MRIIAYFSTVLSLLSVAPPALAIQVDNIRQSGSFITAPDGKKTWVPSQLRWTELTQNVSPKFSDQKLRIHKIEVQGNCLVPSADILSVIKTKEGDRFVREQISEDLKAIEQLGFFDNLHCIPMLLGGHVSLVFVVKEQAAVNGLLFTGCTAFKKAECIKFFSDLSGKPRNDKLIADSIEKFEAAYREKGYLLARVTSVSNGKAGELRFNVDEWMIGQLVPEPSVRKPTARIIPAMDVGAGNGPQLLGISWMDRYPWDRRKFLFDIGTREYFPAPESSPK